MLNLIKIELYKLNTRKNIFTLISGFLLLILLPVLILKFAYYSTEPQSFFYNLSIFFEINSSLLLPLFVGIFTLNSICCEFNNKPIKHFLMSGYERYKLILAKYLAISLYLMIGYIFSITFYTIISYLLSNKNTIYISYSVASKYDIAINLMQYNLIALLQLLAIISFSLMLGLLIKKQGIAILIYIISMILFTIIVVSFENLYSIPKYTFFSVYPSDFIGVSCHIFTLFKKLLTLISNISLFLLVSLITFDNYNY